MRANTYTATQLGIQNREISTIPEHPFQLSLTWTLLYPFEEKKWGSDLEKSQTMRRFQPAEASENHW